jgi:hypothetical protein
MQRLRLVLEQRSEDMSPDLGPDQWYRNLRTKAVYKLFNLRYGNLATLVPAVLARPYH